jgi:hypothetical protein
VANVGTTYVTRNTINSTTSTTSTAGYINETMTFLRTASASRW